jgi:hypothetical protein
MLPTLVLPLGPRGELRLCWSLEPHGFRCSLEGAGPPVTLSLDVRPGPPGFTATPRRWTLTRPPGRAPRGDVVLGFRDGAHDALVQAFRDEQSPAYEKRIEQEGLIRGLLQVGAAHALSLLDPALRALVRPFHRAMRWPVYEAVASDSSGRLGQLARAAPGVLSFALTHAADSDAQGLAAAEAFRQDVVRGVPLQRALAPLLEDWALFGARRRRRVRRGRFGPRPDTFAALAALPGEARAGRVRAQQLLLRRALPQVGGGLLWLPPPLELVPEDIPRTPRAQVRWFKAMKR